MKITRIRISRTPLPYGGGACVWGAGNAIRVARATRDLDFTLEQPCRINEECQQDRRVRDYLVENRIPVVSEDTWGGEITSSVVAHFAASTPPDYLQNTTDLMTYNTRSTGIGGQVAKDGKLYAPDTPGLGVTADFENPGAPVAQYGEPA